MHLMLGGRPISKFVKDPHAFVRLRKRFEELRDRSEELLEGPFSRENYDNIRVEPSRVRSLENKVTNIKIGLQTNKFSSEKYLELTQAYSEKGDRAFLEGEPK